jgi:hypothetical protein
VLAAQHSTLVFQSNAMSADRCRLLSRVFSEAVMLRRMVFCALLGLGLSGCYYYAGYDDVYTAPYYYPGYYSPYYYGGYYPRYYGGYHYRYYGGQGPRYYGGGYHRWHH